MAAVIAMSLLMFNTVAYAADDAGTVDAGITPDSVLYSADKLFEDLQLVFTFDSEKDANLLLQFAQERLAEAQVMTERRKSEFVQTAINDYMTKMQQAQDKVVEVVADEDTSDKVKDELSSELEETSKVDESVRDELKDGQKAELDETMEEVLYTANVVKDIAPETIKALREQKFGYGQIAHIAALSELSDKPVDEVAGMFKGEDKGTGKIAKELGIHPSMMNKKTADATDENDGQTGDETNDGTTVDKTQPVNSADTANESAVEPENVPSDQTQDNVQVNIAKSSEAVAVKASDMKNKESDDKKTVENKKSTEVINASAQSKPEKAVQPKGQSDKVQNSTKSNKGHKKGK